MIAVARTDGAARVVRAAVLEVWVHAGLLGGQSMSRIVFEKSLQQCQTILLQARDDGSIGALPLGEGGLVIGERGDAGPFHFIRGAEDTMGGICISFIIEWTCRKRLDTGRS